MTEAAKEIRDRFERTGASGYAQRTLLIVSDGEPTDGDPREIFATIRKSGVTVIACFVTNEDIADPRTLVASSQSAWTDGARLMWDIASELDETSPFARYLLAQGWSLEPRARLFVQVNHSDVLKEFMRVAGSHFIDESVELLPKGQ